MRSEATRGLRGILSFSPTKSTDTIRAKADVSPNKVRLLKLMAAELQQELESLSEVQTPPIEHGIDFYNEVSRFEIELLRRALTFVGGHQGKAARLLNLKMTTLNSKIKRYQIKLVHSSHSSVKPPVPD